MKKNFLFGTLAVLLAGFWFGGASLADCTATEQWSNEAMLSWETTITYCSLYDAITAANDGDTVTLLKDITISALDKIIVDNSIKLNLDWHTITSTDKSRFIFTGEINAEIYGSWTIKNESTDAWHTMDVGHTTKLTIVDWTYISLYYNSIQVYWELTVKNATVQAYNKAIIFVKNANASGTIENWIFNSSENVAIAAFENSTLRILNWVFESPKHQAIYVDENSELIIDWGNFSSSSNNDKEYVLAIKNSSWTINSGTFISNNESAIYITWTTLTINDWIFNAKYHGIDLWTNNTLTINNWTFTSSEQWVIYTENNAWLNTININGWTFNSNIASWKIWFWLATAGNATVVVTGWVFNVQNWVWIIARWWDVKLWSNVVINVNDNHSTSWVAGYMNEIDVPVGYKLVMDVAANYNWVDNLAVENELWETYVIAWDTSNYTGYTVKYWDNESEKTVKLSKSSTSAIVTKPTPDPEKAGYQFSGWYNGDDAFDFATAISSDVELVSKWNEVIESIEIEWVVDPVAWATPFTWFTVTTWVVLNSTWTGDDDAAFDSFVAWSGYTLTIEIAADTWYVLSGTYTVKVNWESRAVSADTVSKTYQWKFKVTFDWENETLVVSGSTVTAPTVSKECNSLDGWYNGDEKVTFPVTVTWNLALVSKWTYTCSRSSGGGGSSRTSATTTDTKADTTKADEAKADETKAEETKWNEDNGTNNWNDWAPAPESKYSQEMIDAYNWAFKNGITTMPTIEEADMEGKLTRIAMAKMLSFFAINVLGKTPDTDRVVPNFPDVDAQLDKDYDNWVTLAYQLGIMWIGIEEFRPNDEVTRWEFATALSRLLFNTPDGEWAFYEPHLAKLMEEKIITVDTPDLKELRWYVMIMLMRSAMEK